MSIVVEEGREVELMATVPQTSWPCTLTSKEAIIDHETWVKTHKEKMDALDVKLGLTPISLGVPTSEPQKPLLPDET